MYYHTYPPPRRTASWREVLTETAVTAIAFAIIAAATWLFCWSFYIPFRPRYAVGVILSVLMAKWLVFRKR